METPKGIRKMDLSRFSVDLARYAVVLVLGVLLAMNGSQRLVLAQYVYMPDSVFATVLMAAGFVLACYAAWNIGRRVGLVLLVIVSVAGKAAGLESEMCGDPECIVHGHGHTTPQDKT